MHNFLKARANEIYVAAGYTTEVYPGLIVDWMKQYSN